jgi:hypothetical protein
MKYKTILASRFAQSPARFADARHSSGIHAP